MGEFGNQIDIEYEVWRQQHTNGRFEQVPQGAAGNFYGISSLQTAQAIADNWNLIDPDDRHFVVEVVSVRTEYGVESDG